MSSSVCLNGAEQRLNAALTYNSDCSLSGALGKVHDFGHKWIVKRENYGSALISGITGLVHSFASSIFHSLWALTAGKLFVSKEPRELAGRCWKDVGKHLLVIMKSVAGIACPTLGKSIDERFFPTVPVMKVEVSASAASPGSLTAMEGLQSDEEGDDDAIELVPEAQEPASDDEGDAVLTESE